MLRIRIIAAGKLKERFYIMAQDEYVKRLSSICKLEIIELPEYKLSDKQTDALVRKALEKEASDILASVPADSVVIALCVEGAAMDSRSFSDLCFDKGASGRLCFIIGGTNGLAQSIKERADIRLSFGPMTFPHHLARIMLLEQVYRAFQIDKGARYHK